MILRGPLLIFFALFLLFPFSLFSLETPTGLFRAFPPLLIPEDNPLTWQKAELGQRLFFDPLLSKNNDISCAHCHNPQKAFSDGGANIKGLRRDSPTLYNVGFRERLFWDGRAKTLEEQALLSIFAQEEMGETKEHLLYELRSIPEYRELFRKAFPESKEITLENLSKAIASFERLLVSDNSPFDRYTRGEKEALTPSQIRGFNLFRSLKTRCFECHRLPAFDAPIFRVVGAPEKKGVQDLGLEEVTGNPAHRRAFLVPTLRNIALTAPYMHNGIFKNLKEVILFYSRRGGEAFGISNTDWLLRGFDITEQEIHDLIAFLQALTDTTSTPPIPPVVPSKLPVLQFSHLPSGGRNE